MNTNKYTSASDLVEQLLSYAQDGWVDKCAVQELLLQAQACCYNTQPVVPPAIVVDRMEDAYDGHFEEFFEAVKTELDRARKKYPACPSVPHAMYVAQREFNEMHRVVESGSKQHDYTHLAVESAQTVAMIFRLLYEAVPNGEGNK